MRLGTSSAMRAHRVVGVVHEHGVRRGGQRPRNGRLDAVDFAAAVELVAEQIQQQHIFERRRGST